MTTTQTQTADPAKVEAFVGKVLGDMAGLKRPAHTPRQTDNNGARTCQTLLRTVGSTNRTQRTAYGR